MKDEDERSIMLKRRRKKYDKEQEEYQDKEEVNEENIVYELNDVW